MKRILFATIFAAASFIGANAQKGNNQIGVAFDLGVPTGDFSDGFKTGFGGQLRGLYGIGTAGHITLTTGWTTFEEKTKSGENMKYDIIPVLLGYRHSFSGFFVEPQAGYGNYALKTDAGDASTGAFTWAVGIGYAKSGVEVGARYQSGEDHGSISQVAFHLGYNFTLGGAKK